MFVDMGKHYTLFLLIIFTLLQVNAAVAQPLFEVGFYIDSDNNRHDGFIDRSFLDETPYQITFKKTRKDSAIKLLPAQIKSAFVSGVYLESHLVAIDTSAHSVTTNREPKFETKQMFLEVIIVGQFSLYQFISEEGRLYFVSDDSAKNPSQLIHKQYFNNRNQLLNNNEFRSQLEVITTCDGLVDVLDHMEYTESNLRAYIQDLNGCKNIDFTVHNGAKNLALKYLNISIISGIRWNKITSTETITGDELFTWRDVGLTNIGLEFEYLIPPSKNRLAALIRTELARSYENGTIDLPLGTQKVEKDIDYLNLSIALRGYLPTSSRTKLFADFGITKPLEVLDGISIKHEIRSDFNYTRKNWTPTIGLGLVVYNRFSVDSKFEFFERTMNDYKDFNNITYTAFSVNLKVFLKSYYSVWDR